MDHTAAKSSQLEVVRDPSPWGGMFARRTTFPNYPDFSPSLQKAEHKNTAQNLGQQYKVSPRPVPMPAIEADPALQESHGCPPATRTQSQHIAVNRRD